MPPRVNCPICRIGTAWDNNPHRPFCSERCRLIDLGAWADERYRIAGQRIEDEFFDDDKNADEKNKVN